MTAPSAATAGGTRCLTAPSPACGASAADGASACYGRSCWRGSCLTPSRDPSNLTGFLKSVFINVADDAAARSATTAQRRLTMIRLCCFIVMMKMTAFRPAPNARGAD